MIHLLDSIRTIDLYYRQELFKNWIPFSLENSISPTSSPLFTLYSHKHVLILLTFDYLVVLFHIINSERVSSQQRQIKRQCNVSMLYNYLPSWLFHCFTFSSEEPLQHKQRGNKSIPGKETQLQYESHTARENQGYEEHVKGEEQAYFITFYLVPIKEAIMPFNQPLLFSVKQHWCIEYVKQADGLEKKYCLHYSQ